MQDRVPCMVKDRLQPSVFGDCLVTSFFEREISFGEQEQFGLEPLTELFWSLMHADAMLHWHLLVRPPFFQNFRSELLFVVAGVSLVFRGSGISVSYWQRTQQLQNVSTCSQGKMGSQCMTLLDCLNHSHAIQSTSSQLPTLIEIQKRDSIVGGSM
jgi:hypothetical protein